MKVTGPWKWFEDMYVGFCKEEGSGGGSRRGCQLRRRKEGRVGESLQPAGEEFHLSSGHEREETRERQESGQRNERTRDPMIRAHLVVEGLRGVMMIEAWRGEERNCESVLYCWETAETHGFERGKARGKGGEEMRGKRD